MKNIVFYLLCLFLSSTLWGQGGQPSPLSVSISPILNANVCGKTTASVQFTNLGAYPMDLTKIVIDLYPGNTGLITWLNVLPKDKFEELPSLPSPSKLALRLKKPLNPNQSITLFFDIQYSCEFFTMLDKLNNHNFEVETNWKLNAPEPDYGTVSSASNTYDIKYAYVTPAKNLPKVVAMPGSSFDFSIPLEVSGNYCDNDFTVIMVGSLACVDYSMAICTVFRNGIVAGSLPLPPATNGQIELELNANDLGIPTFCAQNYPDGMGKDLTLKITGVKTPCGCGSIGSIYPINIGVTTCNNNDAPDDCKENGQVKPQETTVQNIVLEPLPVGNLVVANEPKAGLKFSVCSGTNQMLASFTAFDHNVYNIDLEFKVGLGYKIEKVEIAGNVFFANPQGNTMNLSFANNTTQNIGLKDLNGDNIYNDLPAGSFFMAKVYYVGGPACAVGGSQKCPETCAATPLHESVVSVTANWNNVCNTHSSSATYKHEVDINPIYMPIKYEGNSLPTNQPVQVTLELSNGAIKGFEGYLNQGNIHQYLCIGTNTESCIEFSNFKINGIEIPNAGTLPSVGGDIDLNNVSPDLLDNATITFDITAFCCPPGARDVMVNIQIGAYFDQCPSCFVTLSCGNASFQAPCAGDNDLPNEGCDLFSGSYFNVYNAVYAPLTGAVPQPAKVYPCDDLIIEVNSTLTTNFVGKLAIGFLISNAHLDYINNDPSYEYVGNITINGSNVDFSDGVHYDIPGKPYSVIVYTSSTVLNRVAGDIISGDFSVRMSDAFGSRYDKMDFFSPVLGYTDSHSGDLLLCASGFQDLYGLSVSYDRIETRSASCENGGMYTLELIKRGGEINGPDFPGVSRPAAVITNNVNVSVNNGAPYDLTLTPTQPTGLEGDGDPLQTLQITYAENCTGNVPLHIDYQVQNRPNSNAPCSNDIDSWVASPSITQSEFPSISTRFDLNLNNPHWVSDNTMSITTITKNESNVGATHAWVQLEYDPNLVTVKPPLGVTIKFGQDCGKNIWVIGFPLSAGQTQNHTFELTFKEGSCDPAFVPTLGLFAFYTCQSFTDFIPKCFENIASPQICTDNKEELKLSILDADLLTRLIPCQESALLCENFSLRFTIENPGQGNMNEVALQLVTPLPPGVTLVGASYDEDFGNCDLGNAQININDLLGKGWTIPNGTLYGTQSGSPNAKRRGHLLLTFRAGCGVEFNQDDLVVRALGIKPCGQRIVAENHFNDIFKGYNFNPDMNIQNIDIHEYDCNTGKGVARVSISVQNWSFADFARIALTGDGIKATGYVYPTGNQLWTDISFTKTGGGCNFSVQASLEACFKCADLCYNCATLDQKVALYVPKPITGALVMPGNICEHGSQETLQFTVNITFPTIGPWSFVNARLICDQNSNGIEDAGELVTSIPSGFFQWVANTTNSLSFVVPAGSFAGCNGLPMMATFDRATDTESSTCLCIPPILGRYCCGCDPDEQGGDANSGALTRSSAFNASVRQNTLTATAVPNPFNDHLSFDLNGQALTTVSLKIFDQLGHEVYSAHVPLNEKGEGKHEANLPNLPLGAYNMIVTGSDRVTHHVLIKQ